MTLHKTSSGQTTRDFLRLEWRFLLFGFLLTFWSGPGQTFVISLFGGQFREEFNLTHGEFGFLYTLATLTSAAFLWKTGPLVDHLPLRKFAIILVSLMILAIALVSGVQGPITLFAGILFVRFMGQGMLSHTAVTAMARRYEKERGRAIAFSGLGFIAGEAIFPPTIVAALTLFDWRLIWPTLAILAALTFLPFIHKLIVHTENQDGKGPEELAGSLSSREEHWTREDLLKDPRFYLLCLIPIAQSGIITGIFFHQVHIIDLKGWSFEWWSLCFAIFAAFSLMGGLLAGFLVDRLSARRIVPFSLLFMVFAMVLISIFDHPWSAPVLMASLGVGAGYTNPSLSSLWAELYGTRHLGAIRSVASVVMVFGSALGPVLMGFAFDWNISLEAVTISSALLALAGVGAAFYALRRS